MIVDRERLVAAIEKEFDELVRQHFADLFAALAGGQVSREALEHFGSGMKLLLSAREAALGAIGNEEAT